MGAEALRLHPEALEVLREVAAHPDSVLLRVPAGGERQALAEDQALARAGSAALSAAERHLVAVYREELAFALRQAAWQRLAGSGPGRELILRRRTAELVTEVPSAREVARTASEALRGRAQVTGFEEELELLEACVASPPERWASVERLCAAAHRLVPSNRGRLIAGSAFVLTDRPAAALEAFGAVASASHDAEERSIALANLAEALEASDQAERALRASQLACEAMHELLTSQLARLAYSIVVQRLEEALDAASAIDAIVGGQPDLLDESLRRIRALKAMGGRAPILSRQQVVRELSARVAGASRRFIDALV